MARPILTATATLGVALAACAPWRSDIELPPGVAAAPVLEVQGFRTPPRASGDRRIVFGPWTAERRPAPESGWSFTLRHDSTVVGSAWCANDVGPGDPRRKGRWQDVPHEVFTCALALARVPDTLHLEVKSDAGRPLVGTAENGDWMVGVRGTDRLRTRSCLIMPTCGWYLTLDGVDIAAVEADASAWVYISPDLGGEVREMAATIAAALLLRANPIRSYGSPQRPETVQP
jgi:hypothetical protein